MDSITIKLPHDKEIELEYGKPIVLIGANGSGKTRFSVRIEESNDPAFWSTINKKSFIHRLSAQKSLSISDSIHIYDHESSERNLFLGNPSDVVNKSLFRFQNNPVTNLLDDYQYALSLLFSEAQYELQCEHNEVKKCQEEEKPVPKLGDTVVDKAQRIWNTLLPLRTLDLSGNGVHVKFNGQSYHGKEMSDGERVILYMICQALVVKPHSLFIIDEPELHIHKAIVKELWTLLENERPDCVFMYLTHDIDFAISRNNASYLWIKSYNGKDWEYEFLNADAYSDLPAELLLEIVGSRQKIVFVEGTKDSYDYKLYQELYRDKHYHVIPCGGCQDVIRLVKAKKTYEQLQSIEVYGIIDRDYRVNREIDALKEDGIYTLCVAEVENLFVVPELLDIMEHLLGCDQGTAEAAKQFIKDLFDNTKNQQISEALSKEITHQLSLFEIGNREYSNENIVNMINNQYTIENIGQWREEKEKIYNVTTLPEILAVFNFKEIPQKIASKYGLSDKEFPKRVLNLLTKDKKARDEILSALSAYVPELP
jgi:ABC-type lipoprotein export system ATPase subunit